jgi:hypothetical protein
MLGTGKMRRGFRLGNVNERKHLGDVGVDGSIIFKWIFKKNIGVLHWIYLTRNRDKWRTFCMR